MSTRIIIPANNNLALVKRAVRLAAGLDPDACGQFKLVWKVVDVIPGYTYALKRTGTWEEIALHNEDADVVYPRHHNADIMRELVAQQATLIPDDKINKYMAWGFIDGTLWAMQPWLYNDPDDDAMAELEAISDDVAYPNARMDDDGSTVLIDWGYDFHYVRVKKQGRYITGRIR